MGGKKIPMNRHATAALERKQAAAADKAAKQQAAEDDAYWADDGDRKGQKKAARGAAKADKAREKAAAKEVTRALEKEEEARDSEKIPAKVTRAQIAKEMTKMRGGYGGGGGGGGAPKADPKVVTAEEHEKALAAHEEKRKQTAVGVDATGLKAAAEQLSRLDIAAETKVDEHPERRLKAAHAAYEAKRIPQLKAENPGLKHSQVKDMCWKEWQKSPENPMVQAVMRRSQAMAKQEAAPAAAAAD
eukprot:TRINITY_DN6389_c0_g3_i1.p1 TRINITY_DN6389_c0_g3~~TRINITY_DN6389_c0_g3_i1.p1  ORF type:complete len:283 (+),score=128.22 TRINITY_DN6389_c0_g3_i1:116-850(+)